MESEMETLDTRELELMAAHQTINELRSRLADREFQLEALAEYTRETWAVLEAAKRMVCHMEAFNLDDLPNLKANMRVIKEWANEH